MERAFRTVGLAVESPQKSRCGRACRAAIWSCLLENSVLGTLTLYRIGSSARKQKGRKVKERREEAGEVEERGLQGPCEVYHSYLL